MRWSSGYFRDIEGFVVPEVVAPDYLHAKGATRYPVIMIDDNVIWQGSSARFNHGPQMAIGSQMAIG